MSSTDASPEASPADEVTVEFYWRNGCGFCMALERQLTQLGVPLDKRDIWADERAAAFVRSVANGNETVPTIRIGPEAMVNPSAKQVLTVLAEHAPHLLPAES